jgi:hypothetical protein
MEYAIVETVMNDIDKMETMLNISLSESVALCGMSYLELRFVLNLAPSEKGEREKYLEEKRRILLQSKIKLCKNDRHTRSFSCWLAKTDFIINDYFVSSWNNYRNTQRMFYGEEIRKEAEADFKKWFWLVYNVISGINKELTKQPQDMARIDVATFRGYFLPGFFKTKTDCFGYLLRLLEKEYTKEEYGAIAWIIFDQKGVIDKKERSFRRWWYPNFCKCMGIEVQPPKKYSTQRFRKKAEKGIEGFEIIKSL